MSNLRNSGVVYVVFSFDDTHYLNLKCVDLLEKYNLKGTFYFDVIRINNTMREDIKWISERHEVGSHSMTHRDLTRLSYNELKYECKKSKEILEEIIEKPVKSFAYPYGYFNANVKKAIIESGYLNARSFRLGNKYVDNDVFALRVTFAATSYGYRQIPFFIRSLGIYELLYNPWLIRTWANLIKKMSKKLSYEADKGRERILHVVIHADFIELKNEWDELEEVFNYISSLKNFRNLTVSEYVEICSSDQLENESFFKY